MRLATRISISLVFAASIFAQYPGLTLPPSGNNQKASTVQFIGPVRIQIDYSSPAVHDAGGKDRRGRIWGTLVPYGLTNLGFGNGKPGPWRAGANENTVFAVSNDVEIEGKRLPAGRYGLHMIPGQDEWTIIFSKNSSSWGSFFYDDSEDALRVAVKPHKHEYREWLTYEFTERRPSEATAELQWEELSVPWKIKVGNIDDIYITRLRRELGGTSGFSWQGWDAAAQYTARSNTHLEDGLKWAEYAISNPSIGQKNFETLSTKALVLTKMGRGAEAMAVMDAAIHDPSATPTQIHQYGRQLMTAKKTAEAIAIFKFNAERTPDVWPVHVGLMRAYAASGDVKKALEEAQKALPQAPDDLNKQALQGMIKTFSQGENITQ